MDVLAEKLREITLLPYEVYMPRLNLAVGGAGTADERRIQYAAQNAD